MAAPRNLVNLKSVAKGFGSRSVLTDVTLGVAAGERIGIVGRNGDGKSTLLRLIAGLEEPDAGAVTTTGGTVHALLGQGDELDPSRTPRDALGELVAAAARETGATAVGGLTMGADAPACAALAGGAEVKAFFVRKETKQHGLQRRVEGPPLEQGERCLIVEDVVTTGGSTVQAIEAVRAEGHDVCGVVAILDRLAGGAQAIVRAADGAPYEALATIDDVYPDRPDR